MYRLQPRSSYTTDSMLTRLCPSAMQQKGASSGCRRQTARQLPEGRPGATEDPPVGDPTPRLRACLRSSVMELKSVFGLKHEYPPDRGGKGLKSGGRVRGSERPSAAVTAERPAPAKRPRRRLGIKAEPCGRSCLTRSPIISHRHAYTTALYWAEFAQDNCESGLHMGRR